MESAIRLRGYTPDIRSKSGCFLEVGPDGALKIEYGRVKPEERNKVAAQERAKERKKANGGKEEAKPARKGDDRVSNALVERLSSQLCEAAKVVIVDEPHVAIAAIIAGCASHDDTCNIRSGRAGEGWQKALPAFAGIFANQLKADRQMQCVTLAQIAASALDFRTFDSDKPPLSDKGVAGLCNALNPKKMLAAILEKFDAKDYFGAVSGAVVKRAISEAGFSEDQAKTSQKSKAELAKFAIANVPKTGWLPSQLRIEAYVGPKPAAAVKPASKKPAAKAAKKKAAKK